MLVEQKLTHYAIEVQNCYKLNVFAANLLPITHDFGLKTLQDHYFYSKDIC